MTDGEAIIEDIVFMLQIFTVIVMLVLQYFAWRLITHLYYRALLWAHDTLTKTLKWTFVTVLYLAMCGFILASVLGSGLAVQSLHISGIYGGGILIMGILIIFPAAIMSHRPYKDQIKAAGYFR